MTLALPKRLPKAAGVRDRSEPIERTLALVPELRRRYGITRVADTSFLDRTGIPTISTIVPKSPDVLSVYNGKGKTRDEAIVSGIMEAVERQVAAAVMMETHRRGISDVSHYLNLDALGLVPEARDLIVDCVWGVDLIEDEPVPVPIGMVQCPWFGEKLFEYSSSNGLASGNNATEALYHAITEMVERHIWSLYHVRSELVPRLFRGNDAPDASVADVLTLPTGDAEIDGLVKRIRDAGMDMRVCMLREGELPIAAIATLVEPDAEPPMAHMGFGCSLSSTHAILRAINESIQSRVVDIQAARDDILRADDPVSFLGEHARRPKSLPVGRWYYDLEMRKVERTSLPENMSDDMAEDLRRVIAGVRAAGMKRLVAIDLPAGGLPISVFRIVAPEMETTTIDGRLGPAARALLSPFGAARKPRRTEMEGRRA